jgi:hypothetical protein
MTSPYNPQPPPQQPPRKGHTLRNVLLAIAGLIVALVVTAVATGGSSATPAAAVPGGLTPPATPAATPQSAPSPTVQPASRVEFVITGQIPAGEFGTVDITYGSDRDQQNRTLPDLSGKVTYTVPFDSSAMYYSVDVNFTSAGHAACKIVVLGPSPDVPTVVAHGSAEAAGSDSGALCSAQAAPDDATGDSWEQEG